MTSEPAPIPQRDSTPTGTRFARHRSVLVILAVGLSLRMLAMLSFVSAHPRTFFFAHPYEMGLVANSLLHGLGYSSPFGGSTGLTAIVAPGYPTLIAAVFLLFGVGTFASALVVMGLQIVLGLLTIWLIMRLAQQIFDDRTATLAGAFWAVSPPLLFIPTIFWETSISIFAFIAMLALALHCRRTPSTTAWIAIGCFCGLAGLVNPALLPSFVAMMAWTAWETRRITWKSPLLGLLALLLVYAAWPIRNAIQFHAFIPLRSTVGIEMYMGNRPGATGHLDESLFPMFNHAELASYLAKGEVAYTSDLSRQAWAYIRTHPAAFLVLSCRRAFRFWTGTGNLDGPILYAIHALLTSGFGFAGILWMYRRRSRWLAVLFALPLLLFPVPYYITHAEFRYRLNIDALLTIPAAYAVMQLTAAWARRRSYNAVPANAPGAPAQ